MTHSWHKTVYSPTQRNIIGEPKGDDVPTYFRQGDIVVRVDETGQQRRWMLGDWGPVEPLDLTGWQQVSKQVAENIIFGENPYGNH
jgi:hypothetical protein